MPHPANQTYAEQARSFYASYTNEVAGAQWGFTPVEDITGVDVTDDGLEFSPIVLRPVADLLTGDGWILESEDPAQMYALTWWQAPTEPAADHELAFGPTRIDATVTFAEDGTLRWGLTIATSDLSEMLFETFGPPVSTPPEQVATWIRDTCTQAGHPATRARSWLV